jgi:hypothetical protein
MFSDERVIRISTGMTFFVHQDQVQGDIGQQGKVRVELLEKGDQFWAILPTEDTAIVEVSSEDLEAVGR